MPRQKISEFVAVTVEELIISHLGIWEVVSFLGCLRNDTAALTSKTYGKSLT